MNRFTRSIAMASARHPWRTITSWAVVLVAMLFLAASGGGTFTDDFAAKGSQSDRARQLLAENFPEAAKGTALVVFEAEEGTTLDGHRADLETVLSDVAALEHVESVADPFAAGTISEDGRIAYAQLTLDVPEREMGKPAFTVLSDAVSGTDVSGLRVELGGDAVFLNAEEKTSSHMGIGLLVALLVLLVVFGTVVAAVIPIGLSIVAVGAGIGGITLLAGSMDVSASAIPVAGLVGLGVGVDYALFVVARYRENRSAGHGQRPRARPGHGLLRRCRRVRGRHRHHRHVSSRHHRPGRAHLDRPVHRPDGVLRRRRGRHPAARAARPAR